MHSRVAFASSLLVAGASLVRGISISSECQSTLLTVAGSSEASCLNVGGLAGFLTTSENSSLVTPLNTWLAGACAQDPCSNQSLSDIVSNITSGCSSDLSSLGISNTSVDFVSIVQQAYPTVRKVACLKESSNNTLCATSLLTEIESAEGQTLSIDTIMSLIQTLPLGEAENVPTYITCSDCTKQAFNVLAQDQPAIASNTTITDALTSQCGASFVDGSAVSAVVEGTGSAAPTDSNSTSGASGLMSSGLLTGVALSSLAAVSSAFLVLA